MTPDRRHAREEHTAREVDCLVTIGNLIGVIAHEINNPLAGIHNSFLLVKDSIPQDHPHYAYVAAIDREIRRIAAVTRRLADTWSPERDTALGVAIPSIVEDAARMAMLAAGTAAASIVTDVRIREPFYAPAGLLRHTLLQVFLTVLQSATVDERVLVEAWSDAEELRVSISYGERRSRAPAIGSAHTRRMLAAVGGACDVRSPEAGRQEITVRIPLYPHDEESGTR